MYELYCLWIYICWVRLFRVVCIWECRNLRTCVRKPWTNQLLRILRSSWHWFLTLIVFCFPLLCLPLQWDETTYKWVTKAFNWTTYKFNAYEIQKTTTQLISHSNLLDTQTHNSQLTQLSTPNPENHNSETPNSQVRSFSHSYSPQTHISPTQTHKSKLRKQLTCKKFLLIPLSFTQLPTHIPPLTTHKLTISQTRKLTISQSSQKITNSDS